MAFSPGADWVASEDNELSIGLWSVPDGTLAQSLEMDTYWVLALAFSADGSALSAVGGDGRHNNVFMGNAQETSGTGKQIVNTEPAFSIVVVSDKYKLAAVRGPRGPSGTRSMELSRCPT